MLRGRRSLLALTIGGLLLVGAAAIGVVSNRPGERTATDPSLATSSQSDEATAQERRLGDITSSSVPAVPPSSHPAPSVPGASPHQGDGIAVALLEENILLEASVAYFQQQMTSTSEDRFETRRISPVIGTALVTVRHGADLLILTGNHKELVRLKHDWVTTETLFPLISDDLPSGVVSYGSLLVDGETAFISFGVHDVVGISEIDLASWRVRRQHVYRNRFANYPRACLLGGDRIGLVSTPGLSIIDRASLREETFVAMDGGPAGIACVGGAAWVTIYTGSTGQVITASGANDGTFEWQGTGSFTLIEAQGRVYGTDETAGVVFACDIGTRACTTSGNVGRKPTDFIVLDGAVYVTVEDTSEIVVLDAISLAELGRVGFPGRPRAIVPTPPPP